MPHRFILCPTLLVLIPPLFFCAHRYFCAQLVAELVPKFSPRGAKWCASCIIAHYHPIRFHHLALANQKCGHKNQQRGHKLGTKRRCPNFHPGVRIMSLSNQILARASILAPASIFATWSPPPNTPYRHALFSQSKSWAQFAANQNRGHKL